MKVQNLIKTDYPKSIKVDNDEHSIIEQDIKPRIEYLDDSNPRIRKASVKCESCQKHFEIKILWKYMKEVTQVIDPF